MFITREYSTSENWSIVELMKLDNWGKNWRIFCKNKIINHLRFRMKNELSFVILKNQNILSLSFKFICENSFLLLFKKRKSVKIQLNPLANLSFSLKFLSLGLCKGVKSVFTWISWLVSYSKTWIYVDQPPTARFSSYGNFRIIKMCQISDVIKDRKITDTYLIVLMRIEKSKTRT